MRLKSIKLAGFKSFVDPTTVNLPGNLCAVVGPNGCGKSNIIDAVRWVMGESSAKNLRGESATDVIFNGSTTRQPVGQASIELVFDNHDHTLAGEYASYNEVSIKRKVTREGQSTYFLNNQKCRRRDVTDLFLGTGLGPRSYSIIEQGMISRLIESRPEELRVYIEEAAGISRYKERRRETSNRISRTRENLARLEDLREELGRQLEALKRQAAAAEQYTQFKQEERTHKSQLAAVQWRNLREKLMDQRIGMGRIQDEINLYRSEQNTRLAQLDVQKERLAIEQEGFTECQGEYYRLGADIARLEQTIEHQKQQEQQWQSDYAETQRQLERIAEVITNDSRELAHLQQQEDQLAPDTEVAQEQLLEAELVLQASEEDQQSWQQQWDEQASEQGELKRQLDVTKTNLQHHGQRFEQLAQELQRLREERENLVEQEDSDNLQLLQEQLAEAELNTQSQQQQLGDLEEQQQQLRSSEQDSQSALDKVKSELNQVQGQVASLHLLLEDAQQVATECPSDWLQSDENTLLKSLKVDAGWEAAVEQVLGDWLNAPFVQESVLQEAEALLANPGLALLHTNQQSVSLAGSLLEKVRGSDQVAGLLGHVIVADSISEAQQKLADLPAYASVILKSGLWFGQGWSRTAKTTQADAGSGLLERQQQLAAQEKNLERLQQQQDEFFAAHQMQREKVDQVHESLLSQRMQSQQAQQAHQQLQQQLALLQQQQAQQQQQYERIQLRIQEQKLVHQELAQTIELLAEQQQELEQALQASQSQQPALQQQKEQIQTQLQQHRQVHTQIQQQVIQLQARVSSVEAQKHSLGRSLERLQEQNLEWQQRKEDILERGQEQGQDPAPEMQQQLEVLVEQRMVAEVAMNEKRQAMTDLETRIGEIEQQQLRQEQDITHREQMLQDQRLVEREIEVTADNIKQQMAEQNMLVEKLADLLPEEAEEGALSRLLEQVQNRIRRLGAINLMAIDEYKEQQERKEFLDKQHEELITALDSLEEAIRKIDRETRSRFKETFDAVNTSLQQLFPKVFGGGRATLELTDDDLLSTGVTIMAQPPGKRNSSIHLLSGGEKALTAIALVFSIFQLNPSPFCMLDEVDAPLDDANVERYARLVNEMSAKVQFVYISHNKIAMEMATQLLGVTMQESGVSRLVTVDIDEAVNLTQELV
ncbi:MAG: chromosome segregation protein SMC [Gammaproteobacteria bacterium]|nr:chromosome segregation protein SMC [Gammaproteobacteria bacterium]